MSCPDILWALEQGRERRLSASARMVLIALADRANGARLCWPSLPTIAVDTGLSVRQAQTVTHKLEALGLVRRELRGRSMHYYILRPFPGQASEPEPQKSAEPRQPLPDSVTIEPRQPLPAFEPGPQQPLPDDPGNFVQMNAATIATKPIKKEPIKKPKTRERAKPVENLVLKEGKAGDRVPLEAAGMAADEQANVTVCLAHLVRGDVGHAELTARLSFIRQRYPFAGFPWLVRHNPAAADIAMAQGWSA